MKKFGFGVAIAALLVAGAANAADLPIMSSPSPVEAGPVSGSYDWTGPYVGAYTGWNWNKAHISGVSGDTKLDGVIVGGTAGYNVQLGSVVTGIETDFGYNDASKKYSGGGASAKLDNDWNGTVRARLGYAFDRYLPYATGGFAYSRVQAKVSDPVLGTAKDSKWLGGWTVGGGLETAVTDSLTVKGEYLYTEVDRTISGAKLNIDGHTAKVGLNYKFGW